TSAWMPAPPEESEPAMVSAIGVVIKVSSRCGVQGHGFVLPRHGTGSKLACHCLRFLAYWGQHFRRRQRWFPSSSSSNASPASPAGPQGVPVLSETLVTFGRLKGFVEQALIAVGLPDADAATVAALMAAADLQGSDGHGVSRLPQYVRRIKAGGFNVRPNIHVVHEHAGTAVLNGDNGMGHLVMKRAAEMAIEKACTTGIGWVN